jgi:hypothetical protein
MGLSVQLTKETERAFIKIRDHVYENDPETRNWIIRGRSARGLYLASILRAPAKPQILARYGISFPEILRHQKLGVRQHQYLKFL